MAKFRQIKNSFIGGEISPTAAARTDLPQYANSCKLLRNCVPRIGGGVDRRPGSFFEKELLASTRWSPRLLPFIASQGEAYCLYLSQVVSDAQFVGGFRATSNTALSTASTVNGNLPYTQPEFFDVQTCQSVDVMNLVHPNYLPQRISRTSKDHFSINNIIGSLSGASLRDCQPYRAQNTTAITMTPAAVSGVTTLTASSAFFNVLHVGASFKLNHAGTIGSATVTAFTSSTVVTVNVDVAFGATTAVATWWESSWSPYRGYPRSVAYFQGRIVYGGNTAEPDSMWFSQIANFDVMSVSTITDPKSAPIGVQPFQVTMSSQQLNPIQWLLNKGKLFIGTSGEEWSIEGTGTAGAFGADSYGLIFQSAYGSAYKPARKVGSEIMFLGANGAEVKAYNFNAIDDVYSTDPMQALFDEYPKADENGFRKYVCMEWDESRKTLWCVDTAGSFFGLSRDKKFQVTAWHTHQMGGFDSTLAVGEGTDTTDTAYNVCAGSVLSCAVVPNPLTGVNDVWLAVKRKMNGTVRYHIERLIGRGCEIDSAYNSSAKSNAVPGKTLPYLVDAAVIQSNQYPSAETYAVTGMGHIEGAIPSGHVINTKGIFTLLGSAVASGSTTIQKPYPSNILAETMKLVMGLPFIPIVIPMREEAGSVVGTSQAAIKRIHKATLRLYRCLCVKLGRDASNLEEIHFKQGSDPMDKSAELFVGDKEVLVDADYDRDGYLYITVDQPVPFCLVGIIAEGQTYD